MSLKVYINGKSSTKRQAKISVYDHGLLYGDGVFEGIRSYGGKVFRLRRTLERLWDSAKAIWLEIPITQAGNGPGRQRHAEAQRNPGRLHPADRDPRPGTLGLDAQPLQRSAGHHHHRPHRALSGGVLREGAGDHHRQHACGTIRRR